MRFLPDGDSMKAADKDTIENLGIPSLELMERAARSCIDSMKKEKLDFTDVLIVCGSGNNGGDGVAIARILHQTHRIFCFIFSVVNLFSSSSTTFRAARSISTQDGTPIFSIV